MSAPEVREFERLRSRIVDAQSRVADLEAERARLASALRREHWQTLAPEWGVGRNVPVCGRCSYGDGVPMLFPCPTLQLLGAEPPEVPGARPLVGDETTRNEATP